MYRIKKPSCFECPQYVSNLETTPIEKNGLFIECGDRVCFGKQKPRFFRPRDPKVSRPTWCPKTKTPCELRVYGFKSINDFLMHHMLCEEMSIDCSPNPRRYAVVYDLHTDLTPYEFWKRCHTEFCGTLLHVEVHLYHVVEIDDGIRPFFFYKTKKGYRIEWNFDASISQNNKMEK